MSSQDESQRSASRGEASSGSWSYRLAALGTFVVCGVYLVAFFQQTLPNNPQFTRLETLEAAPGLLLDAVWPTDPPPLNNGWHQLRQRFPVWQAAGTMTLAALALGQILLRLLGVRHRLRGAEHVALAGGLGLSSLSLVTLGLGLWGQMSPTVANAAIFTPIASWVLMTGWLQWCRRKFMGDSNDSEESSDVGELCLPGVDSQPLAPVNMVGYLLLLTPFVLCMLLGSSLPPSDFDVREYHLQGPKEFFLQDHIGWLPHNVYTSFPFLTEMLSLLGMMQTGNWFVGALAGQVLLMTFGLWTTLAVFAVVRELAGSRAAWLAAAIHLSTPWTYRISTIAYAEGGLTCYVALTTLVLTLLLRRRLPVTGRSLLLLGLIAGSGMATKYPGLISTVAVASGGTLWIAFRTARSSSDGPSATVSHDRGTEPRPTSVSAWRLLAAFGVGVLLTVGPWLLKNASETGNPVYPLAWSVFGGADWDAELDAKWRRGHSPPGHTPTQFVQGLRDVTLASDWQTPLGFGLALAAFWSSRRGSALGLWLIVLWLFGTWWVLTHRIDRFWIPLLPVVAMLAGLGTSTVTSRFARYTLGAICVAAMLFNLALITSPLCGNNQFLAEYRRLGRVIEPPGIRRLNVLLPDNARVLCVGEAEVFNTLFEVRYNTVFDRCLLEEWMREREATGKTDAPARVRLRSPTEVDRRLKAEGITHIYVNWAEILRYRTTYGYTDFVHPEIFGWLLTYRITDPGTEITVSGTTGLSPSEQRELSDWGRQLLHSDGQTWTSAELYVVQP